MDRTTGKIFPDYDSIISQMSEEQRAKIMRMFIPPTEQQLGRGKVGRNDPCPCGSGKKFKKCCYLDNKNGV
jgi:uncharacterized protein YecA (UPF0149 family)